MSTLSERSLGSDYDRFLSFVAEWQRGHVRADQMPHCIDVARLLNDCLTPEPGATEADKRAVILAGLGHDLYEDTPVTPETIIREFDAGDRISAIIREATEPEEGVGAFVEQVAGGSEEVKLVKLCDLASNYRALVFNGLVVSQSDERLDAIQQAMSPMAEHLATVTLHKYPVAGQLALAEMQRCRDAFAKAMAAGKAATGHTANFPPVSTEPRSVQDAIGLAAYAHAGQTDKAGADYITHPLRVMEKVDGEDEKIVAVLHDVLEDTYVTRESLLSAGYPVHIVEAIEALTKRPDEEGSDAGYDRFIRRAAQNPLAKAVKLADLQDNMDLSRIAAPTESDLKRLEKYRRAVNVLTP